MMRATKKPVERLQNLYRILGKYGGRFVANNPEDFNPVVFEIGNIVDDTAKAMIGICQHKEPQPDDVYAEQFFLEIIFCKQEIAGIEIKGITRRTPMCQIDFDEDGFAYIDGKPTTKWENLNNMLQKFLREFEPLIFYVERGLATAIKKEEPTDDKRITIDIKEIDNPILRII